MLSVGALGTEELLGQRMVNKETKVGQKVPQWRKKPPVGRCLTVCSAISLLSGRILTAI